MPTDTSLPQIFEWQGKPVLTFRTQLVGPPTNEAREIWLLLHGYRERSSTMIRRFSSLFEKLPGIQFVVPNGFFPIPRVNDQGVKEAYAWYFYEYKTKRNLISPQTALPLFQDLLRQLGHKKTPIRILGFSQGGILAPILAAGIKEVIHTIGISCLHRQEYYPEKVSWRVDAIHGEKDAIIPYPSAKESYEHLQRPGMKGSFYTLPNLEHDVNPDVISKILELI